MQLERKASVLECKLKTILLTHIKTNSYELSLTMACAATVEIFYIHGTITIMLGWTLAVVLLSVLDDASLIY